MSTPSTLTIAGVGFDGTSPANNKVLFNLGAVGNVDAATATSLTVSFPTPPATKGALTVVVTSFGVSSGAPEQVATVVADPTVTSNEKKLAANAPTLAIAGSGFEPFDPSANQVTFFNGAQGVVTASTSTSLVVTFTSHPTSLGTMTAVVSVYGGTSGSAVPVATIVDAPTVVEDLAYRAQDSTSALVITGSGFDATGNPADNLVSFDLGAYGVVSSATPSTLTVTLLRAPATTGPLNAVVSSFGGASHPPVTVAVIRQAPTVRENVGTQASDVSTLIINGSGFDDASSPSSSTVVVTLSSGTVGSVAVTSPSSLIVTFSSPPDLGPLTAQVTSFTLSSGAPVQVATITLPPSGLSGGNWLYLAWADAGNKLFAVAGGDVYGNGGVW